MGHSIFPFIFKKINFSWVIFLFIVTWYGKNKIKVKFNVDGKKKKIEI